MPQDNIENLLKIQSIQPETNVVSSQPSYKSSQFSGGQVQLGQVGQQVGPTGEAAMYQSLAEIATGGAKAINIFADISSSIDKDKIKKAELYFGELNTQSDLTPDQKQAKFDEYTKDIWTPILGDDWRRQMAIEADKNWTSKEARNKYESSRYEDSYSRWKELPDNLDRPETNELISEFNDYYESMYPSARYNNWYKQVYAKTRSAISLKQVDQSVQDFRGSTQTLYDVPSKEELDAYYDSANMEQNAQFEASYKTFFDVKSKIDSLTDPMEINSVVHQHMLDTLKPKLDELRPEALQIVLGELDQVAQGKTKEILRTIRSSNIKKLKQEAVLNIASNEFDFASNRKVFSYLDNFTKNIGNVDPINRKNLTDNLIPLIWKTLSSGDSPESIEFRSQDLATQVETVKRVFKNWYETTPNNNFDVVTGITKDKLDDFLGKGEFAILSDDKLGGQFVTLQLKTLDENASQTKNLFPLQTDSQIQTQMEKYRNNAANTLGISVESLQTLAFEIDQSPSFSTKPLIADWFKTLPKNEQEILMSRGYTANNFAKLDAFRTKYVDLETSAKTASVKPKTGTESSNPLGSYTDNEIKTKIIMNDKDMLAAAFVARSIVRDPKKYSELDSATAATYTRIDSILTTMDKEYDAFISSKAEVEKQSGSRNLQIPVSHGSLFEDEKGNLIPTALSPQSYLPKITTDSTGSLDKKGVEAVLRLEFIATQLAKLEPSNPQKKEFQQETLTLLRQVGQTGFRKVMNDEPSKVYAITAALNGLAQADPNFISTSNFVGDDSAQLTAMTGLLITASRLSGGILDVSPGDNNDPNAKKSNKNPMQRVMDSWNIMMDIFANPMTRKGSGTMNPLISGSFNRPIDIKEVVGGLFQAYSSAGPNSYRDSGILKTFVSRLNFPGKETDDEKLTAFGLAVRTMTGSKLPRLGKSAEQIDVKIPTDSGYAYKNWNDLTTEQQIGVYLTEFHDQDPTTAEEFFAGWIRSSQDPETKDIYNLDMFINTASFIREHLLQPSQPGKPRRYMNVEFDNSVERGNSVMSSKVVNDGTKVSRGQLLEDSLAIGGYSYKVNTQPVEHTWNNPGTFEDKSIPIGRDANGNLIYTEKTSRIRIGETKTEDEFVLGTQLSATMDTTQDSYDYYKWWTKTLGLKETDRQIFYNTVKKMTGSNTFRSPSVMLGTSGMESTLIGSNPDFKVRPALFDVLSVLHKVDVTSDNLEISVDHRGNMYYNIGDKRYLVEDKPPRLSSIKTQYSDANEASDERGLFLRNKKIFDTQRAYKRAASALQESTPVYSASPISYSEQRKNNLANFDTLSHKTYLDEQVQVYWKEAFASDNPYNWISEHKFEDWYKSKESKEDKTLHPNFRQIEEIGKTIKSFISGGFKYIPQEKQQEYSKSYIDLHFGNRLNRRYDNNPNTSETNIPYDQIWFNAFKEFWMEDPIQRETRINQLKKDRKNVADSYFETQLRNSWKPALEDVGSLDRKDFKTQEEWNKARQELQKRNRKAENGGY